MLTVNWRASSHMKISSAFTIIKTGPDWDTQNYIWKCLTQSEDKSRTRTHTHTHTTARSSKQEADSSPERGFIWCELSLCVSKCKYVRCLCARWHFAGVFLSIVCSVLSVLKQVWSSSDSGSFNSLWSEMHLPPAGGSGFVFFCCFVFYRSPPAFSQCIFHGSLPMSGFSPVPTSCTVYLSRVFLLLLVTAQEALSSKTRLSRYSNRILTKVTSTRAGDSST